MSMSPRLAPEPAQSEIRANSEVQPFPYADAIGIFPVTDSPDIKQEPDTALIEQRAYEAGRKEGWATAQSEFDHQLKLAQQEIQTALNSFAVERKIYYQKVEEEAVKLSLAIAQKILHRAVQVDPLVLAGMAHVAMQKLDTSTEVTLKVSSGNMLRWREYFEQPEKSRTTLTIVEDPTLRPHACALQTALGTAEIAIDSQLLEIEKGFADLLAQRPK